MNEQESTGFIDFKTFESKLPELFTSVKKYVVDVLGFQKKAGGDLINPCLLEEEQFKNKVVDSTDSFLDLDGNLYLNYDRLKDSLYAERTICRFAYSIPIAYVLQETVYGNWLREETKKNDARKVDSHFLVGVGKVVELDAVKSISGYKLKEVEDELIEDLEYIKRVYPSAYEVYEISRKLQQRAAEFDADMNKEVRQRILKAALTAASRDKNFDLNYKELASMPLEEIYEIAGGEVLRPEKSLEKVEKSAERVKIMILEEQQWRSIKPEMERLRGLLYSKGFPPNLRNKLSLQIENCSVMERTESFREELIRPTRDLLEEILDYCKIVKERLIKIMFY